METKNNGPRIIISGGGTGGHIFPAVSIANAIKELRPDAEILFVGAEGRMEMQRVPDAGYKIIGRNDYARRSQPVGQPRNGHELLLQLLPGADHGDGTRTGHQE